MLLAGPISHNGIPLLIITIDFVVLLLLESGCQVLLNSEFLKCFFLGNVRLLLF